MLDHDELEYHDQGDEWEHEDEWEDEDDWDEDSDVCPHGFYCDENCEECNAGCEHGEYPPDCQACYPDEDDAPVEEDVPDEDCPHGRSRRWSFCDVCGFDALPF